MNGKPKRFSTGISFNPGTLYSDLESYGKSLNPVVSPSALTSRYVREGLIRDGFLKEDGTPTVTEAHRDAIIGAIKAGVDPVEALVAATTAKLAEAPVS